MKIEELKKFGISEEFLEKIRLEHIKTLYPPQAMAVENGLFENKNLILSFPTASGKTLLATLAIIKKISQQPLKAVYIVPLIALANEKYNYFKAFFNGHIKVSISVGNLDSPDPWLKDSDLVVVTSEKLDSLIRHRVEWIRGINLIIVDEIHLIHDESRGPTLEILLSLLRKITSGAQVLALSATIKNADELSGWLGANLVESDFRPVKLHEGVCYGSEVTFSKSRYHLDSPDIEGLVLDTKKRKKQMLVFVSSRRSAESLAEKLSGLNLLTEAEKGRLNALSSEAAGALETPTKQCRKLSLALKRGVAFHHAGLLGKQKRLIEEGFRLGQIKVIVATPTLAMGINLPAFRVLVRDVKRYSAGRGSVYIPVLEYKQFAGRAGRPQYDEYGESIILAKSEEDVGELFELFIRGTPEKIESKLAQESTLRMHSLSLVACGFCQSKDALLDFFASTFFGYQYKDIYLLEEKLDKILWDLRSWGFIEEKKDRLHATSLGQRVSQLYLDPRTAYQFILCLKAAQEKGLSDLGMLQMICFVEEMQPSLSVGVKDAPYLNEAFVLKREDFLVEVPQMWDDEYEYFLRSLKTALALSTWTEEAQEDQLLEIFNITPGELHAKLDIAHWLIYCVIEISQLTGFKEFSASLKKMRVRLLYGVKEELLELVALREIGRMRARKLFANGIKDVLTLKNAPPEKVSYLLGPKVAQAVLSQVSNNAKVKSH